MTSGETTYKFFGVNRPYTPLIRCYSDKSFFDSLKYILDSEKIVDDLINNDAYLSVKTQNQQERFRKLFECCDSLAKNEYADLYVEINPKENIAAISIETDELFVNQLQLIFLSDIRKASLRLDILPSVRKTGKIRIEAIVDFLGENTPHIIDLQK